MLCAARNRSGVRAPRKSGAGVPSRRYPHADFITLSMLAIKRLACYLHNTMIKRVGELIPVRATLVVLFFAGLAVVTARYAWVLHGEKSKPLRSRLLAAEQSGQIWVRGKIVSEPVVQSDRRVDLTVRVHEVQLDHDPEPWSPSVPECVHLRAIVSANADRPVPITKRLPELAVPSALGKLVEANAYYRPVMRSQHAGSDNYQRYLLSKRLSGQLYVHWRHIHPADGSPGGGVTSPRSPAQPRSLRPESRLPPDPPPARRLLPTGLLRFALSLKHRMTEAYHATLPGVVAQFACAATLGSREALNDVYYRNQSVREAFQCSGTAHILAVSGLHVGILAAAIGVPLRLCRLPRQMLPLPLTPVLLLFLLITGGQPATLRAVMMTLTGVFIYSFFPGRLLQVSRRTVWLAAFAMLSINPLLIWSAGFQISFIAVLSLIYLTPPIQEAMSRMNGADLAISLLWFGATVTLLPNSLLWGLWPWSIAGSSLGLITLLRYCRSHAGVLSTMAGWQWTMLPSALRELVSAQFAIQVGLLIPLSGNYFGTFSVGGIGANLIAIPIATCFVPASLATALLSLAGITPLASIAGFVSAASGHLLLWLAHLTASLAPNPQLRSVPLYQLALYYFLVLGGALVLNSHLTQRNRLLHPTRNSLSKAGGLHAGHFADATTHNKTRKA